MKTENGQWTTASIPDQRGRVVIITGGNSGIGYEAARALAEKGAIVVLAVRSLMKGERAAAQIRSDTSQADVRVMTLNLADLASVEAFAGAFRARFDRLDVLINNAGVMAIPQRQTADGFEMQFGTNHLGHFALTGHLLDLLLATPGARVVTVSSSMHRQGTLQFDDLNAPNTYSRYG
ncbi:MAG: SDR family NAD(P)-dependent oxidoreductase, partial [Anaerolineae bacterium]|nr:SDR family NAD(P)-dependent oxidoreductase [Anaerolineae bacterium]